MRFSYLLWFAMSVAGPVSGLEDNRTLHDVIHEERRYVLFNSRRLSGECLDICVPEKTPPPTEAEDPVGAETQSPTGSPTDSPTVKITGSPTSSPTKNPTKNPTTSPTSSPTFSPTESPTTFPTTSPTGELVGSVPTNNCADIENLGRGFSEATSDDPSEQAYDGECYPPIVGQPGGNPIVGRDDSIAVFAGKNYIGRKAAEVEGKMVVLGDLKVKKNGPGNFVSVGVGTHVIPNPNTECIIVGGDLEADRDIQVYNQAEWMTCDIIYRGNEKKVEKWKTNGEVIHDPNYDMTYYEDMKDVFIEKSQFWKNLPSTGSIVQQWAETRFECTDSDEIQVFNFVDNKEKEYLSKKSITDFIFSDECEGKSILINVHGSKNIKVNANAMFHKGKMGYQAGGFSTCLTQSILWNFPDAKKVDIGNGKSSEFHGSILTGNPEGELELTTTGHSGRAIVVGTIIHDAGGSEFHSYPYNPPRALPDPAGLCEMNPNIGKFEAGNPNDETTVDIISVGAQTQPPTGSPTASPIAANEAVSGACVHIPQDRLPANSWKTNDEQCATCHVDNLSLSWPCDVLPRLCEGDCWFVGEPLPPHNPEDIEGCEPIKQARLTSGSETTIEECQKCADGYLYWPCSLDSPICEGRGCGF